MVYEYRSQSHVLLVSANKIMLTIVKKKKSRGCEARICKPLHPVQLLGQWNRCCVGNSVPGLLPGTASGFLSQVRCCWCEQEVA